MPPVKKKGEEERKAIYTSISSEVRMASTGNPITVQDAKEWLGWEEIKEGSPKDDYLLLDVNKAKIRCANNVGNRPFNEQHCLTICQDILNKHFAPRGPNGETVIIGKTGLVLSAQHRLIALVLAYQQWVSEEKGPHWKQYWETEPTIDSVVVYGVDETEETVRTLDNTRPRGFSDVLYTSGVFKAKSPAKREKLSKLAGQATKNLWDRTGHRTDAFNPKLTNSELIDYINQHPHIARAVNHIFTDDVVPAGVKGGKGVISQYLGAGPAAALLYLMGCSGTSEEKIKKYRAEEVKNEKVLDWSRWDKACEFWSLIAQGAPQVKAVTDLIRSMADPETMYGGRYEERSVAIMKAWNGFIASCGKDLKELGKVTAKDVDLKEHYKRDADGNLVFKTLGVNVGGIDSPIVDEEEEGADEEEQTPEEIEEAKLRIRKERQEAEKAKLRAAQGGGGLPKQEKKEEDEENEEENDEPTPPPAAPKKPTSTPPAKKSGKPPLKGGTER